MSLSNKNILITGAAGFIGAALVAKLIDEEINIIGIDNINNYYSPLLKIKRIENLKKKDNKNKFTFLKSDIRDKKLLNEIFKKNKPSIVINLAAQAGVRYSLDNPTSYIENNLMGFLNILEACRNNNVDNLIYASSSSVYGGNKNMPFNENQSVDHPLSLYAASKKSNEMLAHSYSHLFQIPSIGLRFFTVYGPYGRPDMAPMIFADSILRNKPINIFNNGEMSRDFTYIDDIVDAIYKCCFKKAISNKNFYSSIPESSNSFAPYRIFNVGSNKPINLLEFVEKLETELGVKAIKVMKPMQPGDIQSTFADITKIKNWIDYYPKTSFDDGIKKFAEWYKVFYKSNYYKN